MVFLRSFRQQPKPKDCSINAGRIDNLETYTMLHLEEINASVRELKAQMQSQHDMLSGMLGDAMKILIEMKGKP
jgi:hypothetical protein